MKFFVGVTDNDWYNYLSLLNPEDVNFWQPGGNLAFKVLSPGAPFLFKLKSPINAIAGIGFFSSHTFLPISVAWDTFENRNGCSSFQQLQKMIFQYRKNKDDQNPTIGCIALTNPIFFKQQDWIPVPTDWKPGIVQGKSYESDQQIGKELWEKVEYLLKHYLYSVPFEEKNQLLLENNDSPIYKTLLTRVRLGQGAFRILVTDAYKRKCAISGEKTLPVLEAAHIKPYASSGPHFISNSLLLRSDLHKLFDTGYLTITSDFKVEISRRIKEEFENGKDYYKYHGAELYNLPERLDNKPHISYIQWHNENVYKNY